MRKLNEHGVTAQQEAFCRAYIEEPIMARAYLKAYPKAKNWKRNTLDCAANRMLNNPRINDRITQLREEREKQLQNSCTLSKRKLIESGLKALLETEASGNAERNQYIQLLKLLLTQQGYMPQAGGASVQVNIQNNAVVGDVTKYLDL